MINKKKNLGITAPISRRQNTLLIPRLLLFIWYKPYGIHYIIIYVFSVTIIWRKYFDNKNTNYINRCGGSVMIDFPERQCIYYCNNYLSTNIILNTVAQRVVCTRVFQDMRALLFSCMIL